MKPERIELPGLGEPHAEGPALYLLVDEELRNTDSRSAGAHLPLGTAYRLVHVISRWAGGVRSAGLLVGSACLRIWEQAQAGGKAEKKAVKRGVAQHLPWCAAAEKASGT